MSNLIICVSGHRPPVLFEKQPYLKSNRDKLETFATQELRKFNLQRKVTKVISGMALGWDQALAIAALKLKIPLLAAVPFQGMESKWPAESQQYYYDILDHAQEVYHVCNEYSNQAYYERDKYIVDNADELFVLYNGNDKGGTAITVQYGNKVNKPIYNCWEEWIKI